MRLFLLLLLLAWPALAEEVRREDVVLPGGIQGILVRPAGRGPFRGVLHLQGSGDTAANNEDILRFFASQGFVALSIDYPKDDLTKAALAGVDYLAGLKGVKRGKVGVNGFSLGGRLALFTAIYSTKVGAVCSQAGRTTSGATQPVLQLAEQIHCPVLIFHGTSDEVVPYQDSVELASKLKKLGRKVELVSYAGAGHQMPDPEGRYNQIVSFFRKTLR